MGDHDAAHIGGWAISGLIALATIRLLRHFRIRGGGLNPSTPRPGTLAMGVAGRMGSGSNRFVAN